MSSTMEDKTDILINKINKLSTDINNIKQQLNKNELTVFKIKGDISKIGHLINKLLKGID